MLESNLKVLLAERDLKISKVSKDTGISRTTLTALCYGHSEGIKFDTLDTLCKYLKITPGDFFNFAAYDYETEILNVKVDENGENTNLACAMKIKITKDDLTMSLPVTCYSSFKEKDDTFNLVLDIGDVDGMTPEESSALRSFNQMKCTMSLRQLEDMEGYISDKVLEAVSNEIPTSELVIDTKTNKRDIGKRVNIYFDALHK